MMEKLGMKYVGSEQHDMLGEMLIYEIRKR